MLEIRLPFKSWILFAVVETVPANCKFPRNVNSSDAPPMTTVLWYPGGAPPEI